MSVCVVNPRLTYDDIFATRTARSFPDQSAAILAKQRTSPPINLVNTRYFSIRFLKLFLLFNYSSLIQVPAIRHGTWIEFMCRKPTAQLQENTSFSNIASVICRICQSLQKSILRLIQFNTSGITEYQSLPIVFCIRHEVVRSPSVIHTWATAFEHGVPVSALN